MCLVQRTTDVSPILYTTCEFGRFFGETQEGIVLRVHGDLCWQIGGFEAISGRAPSKHFSKLPISQPVTTGSSPDPPRLCRFRRLVGETRS